MYEHTTPSLVLLGDLDADSIALSARIREVPDRDAMIIAVLNQCASEQLQAAFEAGVDDCLLVDAGWEQLSSRLSFVERRVHRRQERMHSVRVARARAQQQALVAEIGRRALTGAHLSELLPYVAKAITEALGVDYCDVLEYTAAGYFEVRARAGVDSREDGQGPRGTHPQARYTLNTGEPVVVENVDTETRFAPGPRWARHGAASGVSVVIAGSDSAHGVLTAHAKVPNAFDADDVHFLQAVANALAGAIERTRTEQALRESEAKARAIVETTVDGVITIDERGHIESFNDAAEDIFGYTEEEVMGRNVKVLMPSPYHEEHDGYMRSYHETGRRKIIGIGREVTGRRKDGSTFPMDLAVSEVQLGDRRIFTGIVRDITERRRLEKEILDVTEQERRRIGQDLHDGLGQMLTGIGLLSQNLARQLEQREASEAEDAAEITDLIREADQYARDLARGLTPVDLEASGLVAALERLVANAERLFDIECVFDEVGSALVHNGTTATHMYRIAQEAVSNAVRHGQAGRIKISLAAGTEQTRLRIQDDGVGFPETNPEGPGMGVNIMEYRARIVGGTLDISSTSGEGTTVTFTLPRRSAGPPDHSEDATTQPERHA